MLLAEEQGLIAAIAKAPQDEGLRLVYADWLEGQGDESSLFRAAMIRGTWDVRFPSRFATTFPDVANFQRLIERQTCQDVSVVFDDVLHHGNVSSPWTLLMRRGFLYHVRCPLAVWMSWGREVVRTQPVLVVDCPGLTRSRIVFRGQGSGDVPREVWDEVGLGAYECRSGKCRLGTALETEECMRRGTHALFSSPSAAQQTLSALLLRWARSADPLDSCGNRLAGKADQALG